jgi:hypothetical protein
MRSNKNKPPNRKRRSLIACGTDHKGIDSTQSSINNTSSNNSNSITKPLDEDHMSFIKRKTGGNRKNSKDTKKKSKKADTATSSTALNNNTKRSKQPKSRYFLSVLSQPFAPWNELEMVIGDFCPEWSHTVRSYIVQHLVRFLELKILTEEFATARLLAPTPLLAQAWQAVILESSYIQVIYDIQDFHERPHQLLKFCLQRDELKGRKTNKEALERTQHLFQSYYGEPMLTSVDDIDTDLSLMTDTSTITDMMGHFLPRCGAGGDHDHSDGINTKSALSKSSSGGGTGWFFLPPPVVPLSWLWSSKCLDAVGDVLFCQAGAAADEGSLAPTLLLDDIEESPTRDETEYDSLFTYNFMHTRHFLCRDSHNQCQPQTVFSW